MTLEFIRHHGPVMLYIRITLAVPKMVAAARRLIEKGEVGVLVQAPIIDDYLANCEGQMVAGS